MKNFKIITIIAPAIALLLSSCYQTTAQHRMTKAEFDRYKSQGTIGSVPTYARTTSPLNTRHAPSPYVGNAWSSLFGNSGYHRPTTYSGGPSYHRQHAPQPSRPFSLHAPSRPTSTTRPAPSSSRTYAASPSRTYNPSPSSKRTSSGSTNRQQAATALQNLINLKSKPQPRPAPSSPRQNESDEEKKATQPPKKIVPRGRTNRSN